MLRTRQRFMLLHLSGKVIRTTADYPFYLQGNGWTPADHLHVGDLLHGQDGQDLQVEGVTAGDEEQVVYSFPLPEESPMSFFHRPIIGFVAGTRMWAACGPVPTGPPRPGGVVQPDRLGG